MSTIGLVTMYLIIQLVVFFSILPIDVNRKRKFLIPANEVGAPENPKILKKAFYSVGIIEKNTTNWIIRYIVISPIVLNLPPYIFVHKWYIIIP